MRGAFEVFRLLGRLVFFFSTSSGMTVALLMALLVTPLVIGWWIRDRRSS
jgi:hypothetical protein